MEIALFGGTFNPPTVAHQSILRECAQLPFIDEVWVMPSGQRRDKHFDTSDFHRISMLEAMIGDIVTDTNICIETIEMRADKETRTAKTHKLLQIMHPNHRFWFVFGMDTYHDMPKWDGGQELQNSLNILVVPRDDRVIESTDRVRWMPINKDDITSSTEVRDRVAKGLDISGLVCPAVEQYIVDEQLYRSA